MSLIPKNKSQVTGQLRFKYFKRPVVPFLHSVPAEILLAPVNGEDNVPQTAGNENEAVPAHRTVACQTVYREGETQTDPFTPDYITNPGQVRRVCKCLCLLGGVLDTIDLPTTKKQKVP